jgi:signal transduction histidine kinase
MRHHRTEVPTQVGELLRREEDRHRAWLHDTVLQVLEYLATGGYGECSDAERLMRVAARAADDLRQVIDGGDGIRESPDFVEQLRSVVDEARDLSGIDVQLDLSELDEPVDPVVGGEIVAVVREALNNARKHSHALIASVECESRDGQVEVRVVDDGLGFDPLTVREGRGIRCSMRERMARCGGSVAIASAPGRGVAIHIMGSARGSTMTESVA